MNKKGINILGMTLVVIFGAGMVIFFDAVTTNAAAGATVEKVDDTSVLSCKYTLLSILGGDYSREGTQISTLSSNDIYQKMIDYYGLPIENQNEWQSRIEAIRSISEFQRLGDIYLCYEEDCIESGWIKRYLRIKSSGNEFDTSISCSARLYGPYENKEVILFILDQ
jgi:hypothetical protein